MIKIKSKDKKTAKQLESVMNYMMDKQGFKDDIENLYKLIYKFELIYGIEIELRLMENKTVPFHGKGII